MLNSTLIPAAACRFPCKLLVAALATIGLGTTHAADTFALLNTIPGSTYSNAAGVSADGSVVVGSVQVAGVLHVYSWTGGTLTDLQPGAVSSSYATGVSGDGMVISGYTPGSGSFRYQSGVFTALNPAAGDTNVFANGISGDGGTVVGYSCAGGCPSFNAVKWSGGGAAATVLNTVLAGQVDAVAYGASQDGSVVVGYAYDGTAYRPAYWSGLAGHDLGALSEAAGSVTAGNEGIAYDVSDDGKVVVGTSTVTTGGVYHATLWNVPTPGTSSAVDLGTLEVGGNGTAFGVSGDGKVVVGTASVSGGTAKQAFRWTQAGGMESVAQWLAGAGITMPTEVGINYNSANDANSDGSVVVGSYNDGSIIHAYLARVSSAGSGIINPTVFNESVAEAGARAAQGGISMPNLALFGAHHRSLLDSGLARKANGGCAWATVDGARYNHSDTRMGLVEAGACKDLDSARIGLGVGQVWSRQDWSLGGSAKFDGQYLIAEAANQFANGVEASITGYYGRFDTTLNRNYQNGAAIDTSSGNPDAKSSALRARADWKNLARAGRFSLSPYASLTWTETRLDAYTETGGGFPVAYGASKWQDEDVRVGLAGTTELAANTGLRLAGEVVHRFDDSTDGVNGQVIGLYGFSLPGRKVRQDSVRLTVDVDRRLTDKSLVTFGANLGGGDGDPSWGLTVGYHATF